MNFEAMKSASARKCFEIVGADIEELAQFFADFLCESSESLVGTNEWSRMADEINHILDNMEAAANTIFNKEMAEMIFNQIKQRSVEIFKERRNVEEDG